MVMVVETVTLVADLRSYRSEGSLKHRPFRVKQVEGS